MKAATLIALVTVVSMSTAYAAEPVKEAPKADKAAAEQKAEKCQGMTTGGRMATAHGKSAAAPAKDGSSDAGCGMDGVSEPQANQMHEHMRKMHGDAGKAATPAAPAAGGKPAAAAPTEGMDHSAHHPKK